MDMWISASSGLASSVGNSVLGSGGFGTTEDVDEELEGCELDIDGVAVGVVFEAHLDEDNDCVGGDVTGVFSTTHSFANSSANVSLDALQNLKYRSNITRK
jgi:hypothetical protein